MYSTLNRIFIPDLFNITAADEVVSTYTFDFTPSFEKKIIKLMATGAALNDQYYLNPQLVIFGLNKTKFTDYVNSINADLREIYHSNTTNWPFSQEEEFILDYFYNEALKPHISGFILSSRIESSIPLSYVSSDDPLLRAFPQANDLLKLITAKFMYLLELNPNIYTIINLGNFNYNKLTASLVAISLIGGELFHNVDFYNMTSNSFDIIQSYITFKDCVFNNINTLFNVMSTDGLNYFLSLEFDKVPSVWEIPNYFYTNRLIIKKIPFIGDLLFQIVDYYCRSNNYITIAPFVEKTVDLAVKYSLQIGHFFNLFSNIQYIHPNKNNLPEFSSNGGDGDGDGKNPDFNRKIKIVCLFGVIIGIAKFLGNN